MKVLFVVFISLTLLTVVNNVYGEESTLMTLLQANATETGVQYLKIQVTTQNEASVEDNGVTTTTVNENNTEIVKKMENSTSLATNSDMKNMNTSETPGEEDAKMMSNDTSSIKHSMTTMETTLIRENATEVLTSTSSSQKPVEPTSAQKPPEPSTDKKGNSGSVLNFSAILVILGFSTLLLH